MTIEELYEILLMDKPSVVLKEREEDLFELIPELRVCKGFDQKNEWHIYDVYEHIMHVVDGVPANKVMRLAALFHDIGKPISFKEDENGVGHFHGHWDESKKIFDSFAIKHNINEVIKDRVLDLIFYHDINVSKLDNESYHKMVGVLGIEGIKELYELKRSDLLAQNEKYHYLLDDYLLQEKEILIKLIEKSKRDYSRISTPEELMKYMDNNISYGWIDKNGDRHFIELNGLRENYRISTLDETIECGLGTCIEQANMIKSFFDRIGLETKVFCHRTYETEDNFDNDVHMHCLVFYKDGDKWYHFEHSNQGEIGIHEYDSYEDGLNKRLKHFEAKGDIRSLTEIPELPSGLSFKEFNEYINSFDNNRVMN